MCLIILSFSSFKLLNIFFFFLFFYCCVPDKRIISACFFFLASLILSFPRKENLVSESTKWNDSYCWCQHCVFYYFLEQLIISIEVWWRMKKRKQHWRNNNHRKQFVLQFLCLCHCLKCSHCWSLSIHYGAAKMIRFQNKFWARHCRCYLERENCNCDLLSGSMCMSPKKWIINYVQFWSIG